MLGRISMAMKDYDKRLWQKLVDVGKSKSSKIISLSHSGELTRLGFKRGEKLEGKWSVKDGKLLLAVRRREKD